MFPNRAPRFESWRGRVCAGQSVASVTREAPIHRFAKPMLGSPGYPCAVASSPTPVVDPIRRRHPAAVDPAFRAAIERDVEHCRDLLAYLRDR